jgi:predicted Zn-dependent peptidase
MLKSTISVRSQPQTMTPTVTSQRDNGATLLQIVGDFDETTIAQWLEAQFGHFNAKEPFELAPAAFKANVPGKDTVVTLGKEMAFMVTGLNIRHSEESADFAAMKVASQILNGRLKAEIRERQGLSYHVEAAVIAEPVQIRDRAELFSSVMLLRRMERLSSQPFAASCLGG